MRLTWVKAFVGLLSFVTFGVTLTLATGSITQAQTPTGQLGITNVSPANSQNIITVSFFVTDDSGAAVTLDATGATGRFTSGGTLGTPPEICDPSSPGLGLQTVGYSSSCLAAMDADTTPEVVATSITYQCTGIGTVTFTLRQIGNPLTPAQTSSCTQATGVTNAGPVSVVASPNVVGCSGRTLITASLRDTNGSPVPLAPGAYFTFATDSGLLDQSPLQPTTAVLNVFSGQTTATVTASTGSFTGSVTIQVFCPVTPVSLTPQAAPTATPGPSAPGSVMTLTAAPNALNDCNGSLFVTALVKTAAGQLVPDGTTVLFLATKGTLNPSASTTVSGTANVLYTADMTAPGTISISAQAGLANGSVSVPIACLTNGTTNGASSSASAGGLPAPPSRPGASVDNSGGGLPGGIRISPPSTGDAGLKALTVD